MRGISASHCDGTVGLGWPDLIGGQGKRNTPQQVLSSRPLGSRRRPDAAGGREPPWARIGEFVGQGNLTVTADTYTHVLTEETELDYSAARLDTPCVDSSVTG